MISNIATDITTNINSYSPQI